MRLCWLALVVCLASSALAHKTDKPAAQDAERMRTSARVLDHRGKPVRGATIILVSRPLAEFGSDWGLDRLVYRSDERGRCAMRVIPGRLYRAWAWIDDSEERYFASPIAEIAVQRNHTLRLSRQASLRVRFTVPEALRRRAASASTYDEAGRNWSERFELDKTGTLTLPRTPSVACAIDLFDASGRLIDSHSVPVALPGAHPTLQPRSPRRAKRWIVTEFYRAHPLAGVRVFAGDVRDRRYLGTTDAKGRATIHVELGNQGGVVDDLSFDKPGFWRARRSRPRELLKTPGSKHEPLHIRMDRSKPLRGRIRIDRNRPAAGTVVLAESVPQLQKRIRPNGLSPTRSFAVADKNGEFSLEGLPSGRIALSCCIDPALARQLGYGKSVYWKAWLGIREQPPRRPYGDLDSDFDLSALPELRLRFRHADGTAARHAQAMVSLKNPSVRTLLYCDHKGRATLRSGIKGLMQIAAIAGNGQSVIERRRIIGDLEEEFSMRRSLRLEGVVVDIAGQTVAGAVVRLDYRHRSAFDALHSLCPRVEVRSDANGRFTIPMRSAAPALVHALHHSRMRIRRSQHLTVLLHSGRGKKVVLQLR